MPLHTPNMVNMMMQTQPATASHTHAQLQQQSTSVAVTAQLGATADLAQHSQELGESLLTSHSIIHVARHHHYWFSLLDGFWVQSVS